MYDPYEKDKYYSEDFFSNQRHVNEKVEQELEEFKQEIDDKLMINDTRNYKFPRKDTTARSSHGNILQLNEDSDEEAFLTPRNKDT